MATRDDYRDIIKNRVHKTFTFNEAIEFTKMLDKFSTPINGSIEWIDTKTKKPVYIGYS